jgi:hypothetical protein
MASSMLLPLNHDIWRMVADRLSLIDSARLGNAFAPWNRTNLGVSLHRDAIRAFERAASTGPVALADLCFTLHTWPIDFKSNIRTLCISLATPAVHEAGLEQNILWPALCRIRGAFPSLQWLGIIFDLTNASYRSSEACLEWRILLDIVGRLQRQPSSALKVAVTIRTRFWEHFTSQWETEYPPIAPSVLCIRLEEGRGGAVPACRGSCPSAASPWLNTRLLESLQICRHHAYREYSDDRSSRNFIATALGVGSERTLRLRHVIFRDQPVSSGLLRLFPEDLRPLFHELCLIKLAAPLQICCVLELHERNDRDDYCYILELFRAFITANQQLRDCHPMATSRHTLTIELRTRAPHSMNVIARGMQEICEQYPTTVLRPLILAVRIRLISPLYLLGLWPSSRRSGRSDLEVACERLAALGIAVYDSTKPQDYLLTVRSPAGVLA